MIKHIKKESVREGTFIAISYFEPSKTLSHRILSPARLTTPEPPHNDMIKIDIILFTGLSEEMRPYPLHSIK